MKIPNPDRYAVVIGKIPILTSPSRNKKSMKIFSSNSMTSRAIYFSDTQLKMSLAVDKWSKLTGYKLEWLAFNRLVISGSSNFVSMNISRSEELRYFVFQYCSIF